MDGRIPAALATLVLPGALLGVSLWKYGSNPIAALILIGVMFGGGLYLLTYTDAF